jgi:hypothetical protein
MLRRLSTVAAIAAVLGLSALPATAATHTTPAASGSFTVPSASSAVKAWGSYHILSATKVKVILCAKRTGNAYFVSAFANAYNATGSAHSTVSASVGPQTPGGQSCVTATVHYTAHLKVYTEVWATSTSAAKTSSVKSIY